MRRTLNLFIAVLPAPLSGVAVQSPPIPLRENRSFRGCTTHLPDNSVDVHIRGVRYFKAEYNWHCAA